MKGARFLFMLPAMMIFAVPVFAENNAVSGGKAATSMPAPATMPAAKPAPQVTTDIINPGGEPKYELKSKFLPGQYRLTMLSDSSIKQFLINENAKAREAETLFREMQTSTGMTILMTVSDFDDKGVKTITMQYEQIKMIDPMLGEIDMDRAKSKEILATSQPAVDEASPDYMIRQLYANLVAAKIEFLVDRKGDVLDIRGIDNITDNIPGNPVLKDMLNTVLGKLVNMLQKGIISIDEGTMPGRPVGVGASWVSLIKMPIMNMGFINVESTTVFKSLVNRADAEIAVLDSDIKMSRAEGKINSSQDVEIEKISSRMKGTMDFDVGLGVISRSVQSGDLDMTINAGPHGRIRLEQQISNSISVKPVKLK